MKAVVTGGLGFIGSPLGGRFLVYTPDWVGLTRNTLAATLTAAGHSWTVATSPELRLTDLLAFDAVFLAGSPVDNEVLIDYVRAGGNVYLAGGTGFGGPEAEANQWKVLLNAFGLRLLPFYNALAGVIPVNAAHPLFAGVTGLFMIHGNSVETIDPTSDGATILYSYGGNGLYGVYETRALPCRSPSTSSRRCVRTG